MQSTNKIKILSPEQAIKIAAGEVVERPVHIIKEILENSIDAQATKISIYIHQAGKECIKIVDNGYGMNPTDLKLSVMQHATSKISSVHELETIETFGFRGEALASINAVSNLTITTKTEQDQTGTKMVWNFGKLIEESLQSHPTGTTLEITNLFDTIPARKKFLKKDETEWRSIITLFQAFCLDYTHIHFQLYHENKLQFNCPAVKDVMQRASQIFDIQLQKNIINLENLENTLCTVSGIVSTPQYYRYDRNQIFIFVNNRWIKNIDLTKAIMRGYAGVLPPQKYPAAIIFITIAKDNIDINIHPKKEEVKFLHPKKIETIITNSIKATLDEYTLKKLPTNVKHTPDFLHPAHLIQPEKQYKDFDFFSQPTEDKEYNKTIHTPHHIPTDASNNKNFPKKIDLKPVLNEEKIVIPTLLAHQFEQNNTIVHQKNIEVAELKQKGFIPSIQEEYTIIGQYKKTYIICEKENNLILIDQHAAHERILYEQFKKNFEQIATIQLIFPEFIKLYPQDVITIAPYLEILEHHGIQAQIFSDTQLIIQATPVHLKHQLLQETVEQIIGWIKELDETDQARITILLNEKIHTKMACCAAIKAGDSLDFEQMQHLLKNLQSTEHRFSCPHGRPTILTLPLESIEKKFKRDYGKKAEQFFDFL